MTRTADAPPADPLLEGMRSELARIEAAHEAAQGERGAHRLYERLLRYRRLIAMLENRGRIAAWRVSQPASIAS